MEKLAIFGIITFAVSIGLLSLSFLSYTVRKSFEREYENNLVSYAREKELLEAIKNSRIWTVALFWFGFGMFHMWLCWVLFLRYVVHILPIS